ncbi:MAG: beta-ketoacyl-ACP synthase II [bacterium]|nr:beta-ketoacyl-ACP synthase II [bacterium]
MTQDGRRVVVTGMGAVTPLGNDVASFWEGLLAGRSGIGKITKFDPEGCECRIAAEVKNLDFEQFFDKKDVRKIEDFTKYAIIAARQAAEHSGILVSRLSHEEIGCVMGVGIGGIGYIEEQVRILAEKGPRRISPLLIPKIIANIAPGQITIDLNLKGPSLSVVTACAAGTHAIGEATSIIQRGDAVAMFAGGSEAAICQVAIAGFGNMQALTSNFNDNPREASRPFDARRSGFVMGEGAGMLVLEEYEHAKARGAEILAEVKGYGLTSDAYHITAPAPEGEGGARSMALALKRANLKPTDIEYINAHGTSTPLNDKNETAAVKTVFGDHAYKLAISSNKSMIGHLLGAAGAVEAIASVLTLRDQIIPPTINHTDPDPDCDLDYVPNKARKAEIRYVMSNSLGFGGHNCTLIFCRNGAE